MLLLIAGLSACGREESPEPRDPVVYTQSMAQGQMPQTVMQATIRARVETDLAFRASGQMSKRLVEVGAVVRQGEVLAILEPQDLRAQALAATAAAQSAHIELQQVRRDLERLQRLQGSGASAEVELERQRARLDSLQARQDQLDQQVQLALQRQSYGELKAPYDGILTSWRVQVGSVIAEGQPVASLAQSASWEAVADVSEAVWVKLRSRPAPRATVAVPAAGLDGIAVTLRELSPLAQGAAGTGRLYRAIFTLPDPLPPDRTGHSTPALALGMGAELRLPMATRPADALTQRLPASALLQDGNRSLVWSVQRTDDGSARLKAQAVTLLRQGSSWVEVQGVPPGSELVTLGAQRLREGQTVRPVTQPFASMSDSRSQEARQ